MSWHGQDLEEYDSVLDCVQTLHSINNGSLDLFNEESTIEEIKTILNKVVKNWKPSIHKQWEKYDSLVLDLIKEVLREPHWRLK